ncbi:MAG: toll/interleukin-1 receptor domain-containing protein [Planctomycetes bacterium]|nr:toll/interleukin-1 receptor domain-containing protein [Planctomycetota bacterium]
MNGKCVLTVHDPKPNSGEVSIFKNDGTGKDGTGKYGVSGFRALKYRDPSKQVQWTGCVLSVVSVIAGLFFSLFPLIPLNSPPALNVFISYRHADGNAWVQIISCGLKQRNIDVFTDDKIPKGNRFRQDLDAALESAHVLLAIMGPKWQFTGKGLDWVEYEILRALSRDISVIPVLINGQLHVPQLPKSICDLQLINNIRLGDDAATIKRELKELIESIEKCRPQNTEKPGRMHAFVFWFRRLPFDGIEWCKSNIKL